MSSIAYGLPTPIAPAIGSYYVAAANDGDDTASILQVLPDGSTVLIATITIGSGPYGAAASPNGDLLAVTNSSDNTVSLIHTAINQVFAVIDVGSEPIFAAWAPDDNLLAIANNGDNTISIIDVGLLIVIETIPVGTNPAGLAFDPGGTFLAVACGDGSVTTIETTEWTIIGTEVVGSSLFGLDIASDGSFIAVADAGGDAVLIVDPASLAVTQTVAIPNQPQMISIDPALAFVATTDLIDGTLVVIETIGWTIAETVVIGGDTLGVAVAPDSTFVAVTDFISATVSIVRTFDWTIVSTTTVGASPYGVAIYTPEPPEPAQPLAEGLKNTWRWVVTDLGGEVKEFLDKIATNVQIQYILDDAAVMTCDLPSDQADVHQLTTPSSGNHAGGPRVDHNSRFIYGLRREEPGHGKPPWVCRFAGIITILQDQATEDEPVTHLTAHDPWMWARSLPVLNPDGSLLGPNGLTYSGKTGNYIARDLLANAYGWIATQFGPTFEWNGLTVDDLPIDISSGHHQTTEIIPEINFAQGTSVGDAWTQLCQTGTIDIVLRPVYGQPGVLCILDLFGRAGKNRPGAVFGWDLFPRNLVGVDDLRDGTLLENYAQYFASNTPAQAAQQMASINDYGPYYVTKSYPAPSNAASVSLLALAEVALRKRGKRTIQVDPTPELAPDPFVNYKLGDVVAVWAGRLLPPATSVDFAPAYGNALRGGIRSHTLSLRVYGFQIDLADSLQETIKNLLLSDPNSGV